MTTRLYIGNLSWNTTEETLKSVLAEGGRDVTDIHMVMDRETGRPRGFAFAEFGNDADATAAIEQMDGMNLEGRDLRVNIAQERPKRTGGGGGGGGGGRY
jgi:RNA recognition motif-containing protein